MSPLHYKVYSASGYVAAIRDAEEAAMLVAALGSDGEVRFGHKLKHTVWREGSETMRAAESYDEAARIMRSRVASFGRVKS